MIALLLAFLERHPWWCTWWLVIGATVFILMLAALDNMWSHFCEMATELARLRIVAWKARHSTAQRAPEPEEKKQ
jgi:hypothetical protein